MRISIKHKLDAKNRIVIPKEALEEAGFSQSDNFVFEARKGLILILKENEKGNEN